MDAAKRFFKQALETAGSAPERVTTDGHGSYPRAIRETLGSDVLHRTSHYLNNILEQDHRGIKQRYYPMRSFGSFASASPFCRAFDEVRQFFRFRTTIGQSLSLAQQRDLFRQRLDTFHALVLGA
jgi:transposase-like protein